MMPPTTVGMTRIGTTVFATQAPSQGWLGADGSSGPVRTTASRYRPPTIRPPTPSPAPAPAAAPRAHAPAPPRCPPRRAAARPLLHGHALHHLRRNRVDLPVPVAKGDALVVDRLDGDRVADARALRGAIGRASR